MRNAGLSRSSPHTHERMSLKAVVMVTKWNIFAVKLHQNQFPPDLSAKFTDSASKSLTEFDRMKM